MEFMHPHYADPCSVCDAVNVCSSMCVCIYMHMINIGGVSTGLLCFFFFSELSCICIRNPGQSIVHIFQLQICHPLSQSIISGVYELEFVNGF